MYWPKTNWKDFWCKYDKNALLVDETTIILEAEGKANAMGEYMRAFKSFFQNELKDGKTLNTDKKREELRQCHFRRINRYNKILYSNTQFYYTLFLFLSYKKVHILNPFNNNHKIIISYWYHKNADKIF